MTDAVATPPSERGRSNEWLVSAPALLVYGALVLVLSAAHMDRLNPDGVAYLRQAGYWANGQFEAAISLYWSPLFPLTMAPLRWAGVDGLVAARIVLGLSGAALLLATSALLRNWTRAEAWPRAILLLGAAPAAAAFQFFVVAPDVLLSALLVSGFALLPKAGSADTARPAFWTGLLAGGATWAKAYALPFGLLHLPISLWWLARSSGRPAGPRILAAMAGFLLAIAPLWGLLTWKNGAPTIGKSGPINHAVVGPRDVDRQHPVVWGLPSPPHVSIWEAPDRLPYPFWSPFASRAYFNHQVGLVCDNAAAIILAIGRLDAAWLGLAAWVAVGIGAFTARGRRGDVRKTALWLCGTCLLYAGGYLPIAFEPRYLNSLALPMVMLAVGLLTAALPARWGLVLALTVAGSLGTRWGPVVQRDLEGVPPEYFRGLAAELQKAGLRGPFAATSWYHGVALAYHTGEAHAGFPPEADAEVVARRLREASVNWIVIFDFPRQPPMPVQDLFPPTRPRALAVCKQEGWTPRADLRVRPVPTSPQEIRIIAFERPRSTGQPENAGPGRRDDVARPVPQNERDGVARDQPAGGEQPKAVEPK